MANVIVIAIIVLLIALAIRSTVKHFKGEGGCCGGGNSTIVENKKLDVPCVAKKVIHITGMKCNGCSAKVQNALNNIEGLAAKVNYKKGIATVQMGRKFEDEELRTAVESAGAYKVSSIDLVKGV